MESLFMVIWVVILCFIFVRSFKKGANRGKQQPAQRPQTRQNPLESTRAGTPEPVKKPQETKSQSFEVTRTMGEKIRTNARVNSSARVSSSAKASSSARVASSAKASSSAKVTSSARITATDRFLDRASQRVPGLQDMTSFLYEEEEPEEGYVIANGKKRKISDYGKPGLW